MKKKICIVYSLYNKKITKKMFENAVKLLKSKGVTSIKILKVPGSFEIPQVLSRVINKYDGFIVIGCIIKGKTNNFDLICSAITNGAEFLLQKGCCWMIASSQKLISPRRKIKKENK